MGGTKRQDRFPKTEGFVQNGHPHPVTSCGRRRPYMHSPLPQKTHSSQTKPVASKNVNAKISQGSSKKSTTKTYEGPKVKEMAVPFYEGIKKAAGYVKKKITSRT